jgi:Fe-S cluster biogenesis protein NfuA
MDQADGACAPDFSWSKIWRRINNMKDRIEKALASIRPALQADGGDVELVAIEGKIVKLRLTGACGSCPMATFTLKQGIEKRLKEMVPEMDRVEAV